MPDGQEPTVSTQDVQTTPPATQTTSAVNVATPANPSQEPEQERFDAAYVKQLRAEAAGYRKELRDTQGKLKTFEDAQLTEQERLQKRLQELEGGEKTWKQERQSITTRYEIMLNASKMGIVDPEAAYKLIDQAELKFSDDGRPANIERVLQDLLESKPYLRGNATGPQVAVQQPFAMNPARPNAQSNTFTQEQIRDPKFYREHRNEIMQAVREGRIRE